jgi:Aspartyl protease/PDZ domain
MKRSLVALVVLAGLLGGCMSTQRAAPKPGLTHIGSKPVTLPGHIVGGVIVVEDKWDKFGPYHFVIDTGSSVTLVSPDIARRYAESGLPPSDEPRVRVRSPQGGYALLPAVTLEKFQLGNAHFEYVPALIYDCTDLSTQFGVRIDGILGFPLFRNAVLTLDYPNERIVLRDKIPDEGLPGEAILFDNADKIPLIPVRLGDTPFAVLIDSGSGAAFAINPAGLSPSFVFGPVDGPLESTLSGDKPSKIGRLASVLHIGSFDVPQPVGELTDDLSSIGGGILSHFTITFDQRHDEVFFQRDETAPILVSPLRGTGLSFRKTPVYWKVVGVVPTSPAAAAGVSQGDLISRINGEAVASWDPARYEQLVASANSIDYTFIDGSSVATKPIDVAVLVP